MIFILHQQQLNRDSTGVFAQLRQCLNAHDAITLRVIEVDGQTTDCALTRQQFYSSIFFHRMTLCMAA